MIYAVMLKANTISLGSVEQLVQTMTAQSIVQCSKLDWATCLETICQFDLFVVAMCDRLDSKVQILMFWVPTESVEQTRRPRWCVGPTLLDRPFFE